MAGHAVHNVFAVLAMGDPPNVRMAALAAQFDVRRLQVLVDFDVDQAFFTFGRRLLETQPAVTHHALAVVALDNRFLGKNRFRNEKKAGKQDQEVEKQGAGKDFHTRALSPPPDGRPFAEQCH
jgi:hypothetical protein